MSLDRPARRSGGADPGLVRGKDHARVSTLVAAGSRVDSVQRERRADQQRGADEQHDGEADLATTYERRKRVLFCLKPLPERLLESLMTVSFACLRCDERGDRSLKRTPGHDRQHDRELAARCSSPCRAASRTGPTRRQASRVHGEQRAPHAEIARGEAEAHRPADDSIRLSVKHAAA